LQQYLVVLLVALAVAGDFGLPEINVALWHPKLVATAVAVPEAAVDKDCRAVAAQHHIGLAGHAAYIEPIAVAALPQPLAHFQLGLGVAAADMRHTAVPLFGC